MKPHEPTYKDILVRVDTKLKPDWGTGLAVIPPPPSTIFRRLKISPDGDTLLYDMQAYEPLERTSCQHLRVLYTGTPRRLSPIILSN